VDTSITEARGNHYTRLASILDKTYLTSPLSMDVTLKWCRSLRSL